MDSFGKFADFFLLLQIKSTHIFTIEDNIVSQLSARKMVQNFSMFPGIDFFT